MLLWPPLTGTQLTPVAPRSWVLPSGHTPGNSHDRRAKPGEGLRCCVCLHTGLSDSRTSPLKKLYGGVSATPQVGRYAQGPFRPRQPPAPSLISGLLDSVMTLGSGGDEEGVQYMHRKSTISLN
ncbi:unnamed protein product [Schistocephalus solidus]|uniref:E4 n=1 Tax=Schistocephalus solidus TaxID=70667 RepID=A0A183TRK4_SCHSO|nr:unnamed protein product [Schistocephalus solidus]